MDTYVGKKPTMPTTLAEVPFTVLREQQPLRLQVATMPFGDFFEVFAIVLFLRYVWLRRSRRRAAEVLSSAATRQGPPNVRSRPMDALDTEADPLYLQSDDTLYCPICGAMYLSGTESCEDCGVELVDESDLPDDIATHSKESIMRVARIRDPIKSQLIGALLRAQGVPILLSRSSVLDVAGTDLYVFESDVLRAKRLINEILADLESPVG